MARCGTLQPLSDDALHHIGDLLMQPSFSRVCRRLWGLLRGHHAVLCHGNRGLASATAALPAHGGRLRTLTIRDRQPPVDHRRGPATADAQDSASDTDKPDGAPPPLLHTLRLHLPGGHMTRLALAVLHGLGDCQHLQTLEVDFSRRAGAQGLGDPDGARQRGDRVAVADAAWCRPPAALRELRLSCTDTPLDPGLLPVKALQALRALQTLTLSLARAHAGLRVLRRLAQLQDCPALTALALHLDGNGLTEEHAAVLAGARFPALRSLTLSLGHNRIGAGGARLLPAAPELRALRLGLGRAGLSAEGLEALGRSLRDAPELRALTVDLARNRLGSRAAEALGAALGHCAGLETLCLDLGMSCFCAGQRMCCGRDWFGGGGTYQI